jgi:diacylglycerol kinase family enzyme
MATHEIMMYNPNKFVLHADTEFYINSDGEKLGTLKISKGSIEWVPVNFTYGYHMSWEAFSGLMQEHGYRK